MRRWLIWFGIGFALFVVLTVRALLGDGKPSLDAQILAVLFFGWALITFWAIPVSIIVWLARGRGPKARTD